MRQLFSSSHKRMERVDGWVVLLGKNDKERKSSLLGVDWGKLMITDHGM